MMGPFVPVDEQNCATHTDMKATSACIVCGKPGCNDCSIRLDDGTVCDDPSHKLIAQEWIRFQRVSSEFEADMIAVNLEFHSIRTQVFSSRVFKQTLGENARDGVNIFISDDNYRRAIEILHSLQLTNIASIDEQLN